MIQGIAAIFWREMRRFWVEKIRLVMLLIQPTLWLVFMGNTISRGISSIGKVTAFLQGAPDYFSFMTCGVIVLGSFVSAVYAGMSLIHDIKSGLYERLTSIVSHPIAIPLGKALAAAFQNILQIFAVLIAAYCFGVAVQTGIPGVLVIVVATTVLNMAVSLFCLALARCLRSSESYFSVLTCIALPIVYASSLLFPTSFMPNWLRIPANLNPLSAIARMMRRIVCFGWDYSAIALGLGAAIGLLAVSAVFVAASFSDRQE